jgi:hypothetical protein
MFDKTPDPIIASVQKVMDENKIRRQVEAGLNEELGITDRRALPHEELAEYDAALEEAIKAALDEMHGKKDIRKIQAKSRGKDDDYSKNQVHRADLLLNRIRTKKHNKRAAGVFDDDEKTGGPFASRKQKWVDDVKGEEKEDREAASKASKKSKEYVKEEPESLDKLQKEDVSFENVVSEIRTNLQEQLFYVHEQNDESLFNSFVNNLTEEQFEILNEGGPTRKHFSMAANTIKAIKDPEERARHAESHASVYSKANPRFDRSKFMAACDVTDKLKEDNLEEGERAQKGLGIAKGVLDSVSKSLPGKAGGIVGTVGDAIGTAKDAAAEADAAKEAPKKEAPKEAPAIKEWSLFGVKKKAELPSPGGDHSGVRGKLGVQSGGTVKNMGPVAPKVQAVLPAQPPGRRSPVSSAQAAPVTAPVVAPAAAKPKPMLGGHSRPVTTKNNSGATTTTTTTKKTGTTPVQTKKTSKPSAPRNYHTGPAGLSAGEIGNRAYGVVHEEAPIQIKESLESFLRNKFLKE